MDSLKCSRCGYLWDSRVPSPRTCPRCKSFKWNEPEMTRIELENRIRELERLLRESNAARVK
jgi:predicted Zn-ribbon and HTH transcriptional regulator